jgi:hypothetical protein
MAPTLREIEGFLIGMIFLPSVLAVAEGVSEWSLSHCVN